jgi:hypothetical protein
MSNNYSIFTSELDEFANPQKDFLFSVLFYDSTGYNYRYSTPEENQFYPYKVDLPQQQNTLAKRWYFGTYRRDVINSDRGGSTAIEFYMRCSSSMNLKLLQFLGVPIGHEFLDEEQRYKHVEFNKRFDKIEIIARDDTFEDGNTYTLYNCNVEKITLSTLDASSQGILKLTATIAYDTFDVHPSRESKFRSDL